ncbi:MHC class II transactivator [Heteronotia binoei]|uniref:MHC class II transactivator n=1 Tax=Heteronotia binoei TaxID=13085 RepID=UPI00292F34D1|nr:MHC class II transactivator [Heteronotia binoei]
MNLFHEILPGVKEVLDKASACQIQALLNLMCKAGVISWEYHQTLLHDKDREDLARKICLTLVGRQDVLLDAFAPHGRLEFCGNDWEDALEAKSARAQCLGDTMGGSGTLPEKGYLDLLHSDVDPQLLYKNIEEELSTGSAADASLEDPDNNLDVFYTVESGESGEEVCLCSDTGEAYKKIAELAEYVLKDKLEEPVKDLFGTCSDAPEPKRQKIGHSPGLCSGAFPLDVSPPEALSLSNFHVQFSVTTITPAGRLPNIFRLPDPALDIEGIQMFLAFLPPSPCANLPLGPAVLNNICLAEDAVDKAVQTLPLPSEKADKRPEIGNIFSTQLKTSLRERCRFVPSEQDMLLEHLYVEGDILQRHTENRSGRNADLRPCDLEEKEKTTMESLFQMLEKNKLGPNKVALILGKAGMGKSLLVQKICLDWSNGRFPQFEFVFRFDCRRLSLLQGKHYSVRQLLFELSVDPQGGGDSNVYRYLLRNPDRVLLIFDGLEELQDLDGFSPCSDSPTRKEPWGISAVLGNLFQKKALKGCAMLLTSRPKDKLHQCLPRVDKILEVLGFSPQQAKAYLARYFERCSYCAEALDLIQSSPYLFSYCYNPDLCRIICFDCKSAFETGDGELPSNLTGLLVRFLLRKLGCATNGGTLLKRGNISTLAQVAWSLGQGQQHAPTSPPFPSVQAKEVALKCGLMEPLGSSNEREECGFAFSSFVVHSFLVALHLVLAKEIKDKRLTKHLRVPSKPKKSLCSWDLLPRFLAGLLFLQDGRSSSFLFREEGEVDAVKMIAKKRKSVCKYIRKLEIDHFGPDRLLEVFHCVRETEDSFLLQHLALRVRPALSFVGFPFTPPDIYILHSVLRKATKELALDLRRSSVDSEGLGCLVGLQTVKSFRAPLGETVRLWERLWEATAEERLQSAIGKFVIDPFKAQTVKDVDDLSALVHVQEKMRWGCGRDLSSGCDSREIPAITDLQHLEFALGPDCGLKGFKKLVEILGAFPALRHLDLDSQKENEIGDEGAAALSNVLPRLHSLKTLNLSQNKITNLGAKKLADALPSLTSLKTLSVYNNSIGDAGAENFAQVLPLLSSLRVLNVQCNKITAAGAQRLTDSLRKCAHIQSLALWNPTIPHGIFEHLQQLDPRIRSL